MVEERITYDAFVLDNKAKEHLSSVEKFKAEIEQKQEKLMINQIQKIANVKYIKLLYQRYIVGMSLKDVSKEIECSKDYTRELHGKALSEFEKMNKMHFGKSCEG